MIGADPGLQIALPGGRVIPWWNDEARTRAELEPYSRRDAETFFRLDRDLKALARFLQPFFLEPPPDTGATGLASLLEMLREMLLLQKAEDGSVSRQEILPVAFVPLTGDH